MRQKQCKRLLARNGRCSWAAGFVVHTERTFRRGQSLYSFVRSVRVAMPGLWDYLLAKGGAPSTVKTDVSAQHWQASPDAYTGYATLDVVFVKLFFAAAVLIVHLWLLKNNKPRFFIGAVLTWTVILRIADMSTIEFLSWACALLQLFLFNAEISELRAQLEALTFIEAGSSNDSPEEEEEDGDAANDDLLAPSPSPKASPGRGRPSPKASPKVAKSPRASKSPARGAKK